MTKFQDKLCSPTEMLAYAFSEKLEEAIRDPESQPLIYSPIRDEYSIVVSRDGRFIHGILEPPFCVHIARTIAIPFVSGQFYHQLTVVFEDGFAWIKLNSTWRIYMKCVAFVPRLQILVVRHLQKVIEAEGYGHDFANTLYSMYTRYPQLGENARPRQFNVNGITNYDYDSERVFAKLLPHTITAMRACEEIYGMTEIEYLKHGRQGIPRHGH